MLASCCLYSAYSLYVYAYLPVLIHTNTRIGYADILRKYVDAVYFLIALTFSPILLNSSECSDPGCRCNCVFGAKLWVFYESVIFKR